MPEAALVRQLQLEQVQMRGSPREDSSNVAC